jgi:Coenzyme PQQ synthesis protein D (PqqD)
MSIVKSDERVAVPPDVLVSEVGGEMVLLNLKTEQYFGLDETGAQMWKTLTTSTSFKQALDRLLGEYDAEPPVLEHDLNELVSNLVQHGLLEVCQG